MIRVFVYGTLKKGEPNHFWLEKASNGLSQFVGQGTTKKSYPLIVATKYNIPFLLDSPGRGHNILGEIYDVDDKMLEKLDELEDHPNFYVRRLEEILFKDSVTECWTYFIQKFKPSLLEMKNLKCYSNSGPDSLPYLERYLRDPSFNYREEILQ